MSREEIQFASINGENAISGIIWHIEQPKFILQIVHGVSEYILRYDDFANYIGANGGVVCGIDNLGHGKSIGKYGLGYFSKKDGYKHFAQDAYTMTTIIKDKYPNIPFFILGHSMGSFIVKSYLTSYKDIAERVVIMGTSGTNKLAGIGKFMAKTACVFGGRTKPNKFLEKLAFQDYVNKYTDSYFAWLSTNKANVEKYEKDPLCGFTLTSLGFLDLTSLLDSVSGAKWAEQISKDTPYLLISGEKDPVGNCGRGVHEVYEHMKNAGVKHVTIKLFEGMRHEILNETNKDEVYKYVLDFLTN